MEGKGVRRFTLKKVLPVMTPLYSLVACHINKFVFRLGKTKWIF